MCVLNEVTFAQKCMCWADIKSIYLDPQKSNNTNQDIISARRDEMGKECECEERRIMIIRNQESHLHVVALDSMGKRMCLVSVTLSVGEKAEPEV